MSVRWLSFALIVPTARLHFGNIGGERGRERGEAHGRTRHYYAAPLDVPSVDRCDLIRFPFAFDCVSANVVIKYARMLQLKPAPIVSSFELTYVNGP